MPTTVYDIKLRYTLDDKATKGLAGVERAAAGASRASSGLSGSLGRLGGVVVGAFGLRAAGSALIGFNSTVEDTKLQIAGMLALSKKTNLSDEVARADKLYASLQKRAASLPGTTADYVAMAGNITQPIIDAGLGMRALEDLTVNATVAAKALGYDAGLAARDIDQAIRGQFRSTDPFAGKVLGAIGYKGEEGRQKFNALGTNEERAAVLQKALMQKQWTQLAEAQGKTFSGVMSTMQDRLQQFLGKVGLPLFQAIGDELGNWNTWIEANQKKVDEIARSVGKGLVDGFRMVKDAIVFLVDHRDTLMMLGKIWLAAKGASMLGGVLGAGGGMLGALKQNVGGKGGMGMGALGPAGAALAGGYLLGTEFMKATGLAHAMGNGFRRLIGTYDGHAEAMEQKFRELEATMGEMDKAVEGARARFAGKADARSTGTYAQVAGGADYTANQLSRLKDFTALKLYSDDLEGMTARNMAGTKLTADDRDLIAKHGRARAARDAVQAQLDRRDMTANMAPGLTDSMLSSNMNLLTDYQKQTVDYAAAQEKLMQLVVRALNGGATVTPEQVLSILKGASEDPEGKRKNDPMKKPGKVNVTIQRIEVKSDDPDRFVFGMVEAFRDAGRNPSGAARAMRGG